MDCEHHAIAIFLPGQGLVHGNREIASQLSPVLMAIRSSLELKGYRPGAEVKADPNAECSGQDSEKIDGHFLGQANISNFEIRLALTLRRVGSSRGRCG
jgi:hypothetical protein